MSPKETIADLQSQWTTLYCTKLPSLAKQRSSVQPHWPVHLDHCFARIILDNAIGEGKQPWTSVLKAPAVRTMSHAQLNASIRLGEEIAAGETDLVQLDRVSLMCRGKDGMVERKGQKGHTIGIVTGNGEEHKPKKRKAGEEAANGTISKYFLPSPKKPRNSPPLKREDGEAGIGASTTSPVPGCLSHSSSTVSPTGDVIVKTTSPQPDPYALISSSSLTPFRKTVLSLLCGIPPGHYTTYAAISTYISSISPKPTCARAVGNALRNNPFAPLVPCHRVLASDGRIGGFGGDWGDEGRFAGEKVRLLRDEGVRFDGKGKVVGGVWRDWHKTQAERKRSVD